MDNFKKVTQKQFLKAMKIRLFKTNDYLYEEVKEDGNTISKFLDIRSKQVFAYIVNKNNYYIVDNSVKTTRIFKEEVSNPQIWKLILINLGLEPHLDVITVHAVKEPIQKPSKNKGRKWKK